MFVFPRSNWAGNYAHNENDQPKAEPRTQRRNTHWEEAYRAAAGMANQRTKEKTGSKAGLYLVISWHDMLSDRNE
jgi:hypothetical protein